MIGLLISASLAFSGPSGKTAPAACVAICNHWSYTGIGWQLGLESDVLSLEDAMNLYDRAGVKTCIDMDTRTYEKLAIHYPEIVQRLARYLKAGDLELTGGTYGQPMGTMFSGESDIRQLEYGVKDIEHLFGYRPSTFLNEEEFTFPQLPQILKSAGYKYASLGQLDTWGKAGCPDMEVDAFNWRGPDGTVIPSTPENSLFQGGLDPNYVLKNWGATSASASFQKLKSQGEPLYLGWEEFGWERPETPAWATDASAYKSLTTQAPVKYVTLTDYMNAYGAHPKDTVQLKMDDWTKSLTWGLGGDQLRIYNNKVEANLDAAERFDAVASTMGLPTRAATLEAAVKDQLASQSHDAGLCEYSRWQGDRMAPLNRLEDLHNFTWGALGYNLLDSANNTAQSVLGTSLRFLAAKTNSSALRGSAKTCTVYNPSFWSRSDVVETGRLYPLPANTRGAVVRNSAGKVVPSQIVSAERNPDGSLLVADVAFLAKDVPSLGYDTYGVSFASHETAVPSDLRADKSTLVIENARVRIKLNPETGAISSLVDKRTGREMLRAEGGDYPVFRGQPDPGYPLRGNIPAGYDSSKAKAEITWIDDGPVRCTVKARFGFTHLVFETYVTLSAGKPYAEVTSRILSSVPPRRDDNPKEIQRGYYLSFAPAFKPEAVVRDYP
ncbi:MAG TPA: glycoside hydrolase family 38 C-terminal domain-containing protein, partial [Fimbriimonadaceae bacterium]|nr:glycoside hydrolase family 38 C-terminal domain-containing protein [Fimbriimonadaceae bacterium]